MLVEPDKCQTMYACPHMFKLEWVSLQGLRLGQLSEVQYKGDSMQRPIASNEIGWLVRILVWLSVSLNQSLQLGSASTGTADEPEFLVSSDTLTRSCIVPCL